MKKLSLVLAGVLLVGGIFAQSTPTGTTPAKGTAPAKSDKKAAKSDKKAAKSDKKAAKSDKKADKK